MTGSYIPDFQLNHSTNHQKENILHRKRKESRIEKISTRGMPLHGQLFNPRTFMATG